MRAFATTTQRIISVFNMSDISSLDKNLVVKYVLKQEATVSYNVTEPPFTLHGCAAKYEKGFARMDLESAKRVSDNIAHFIFHTAGIRVRFATDSEYIGIKATLPAVGRNTYFSLLGSASFDLFRKEEGGQKYIKTFAPKYDIEHTLTGEATVTGNKMYDYTLFFPLLSLVSDVEIILDKDAKLQKAAPYKVQAPVVFYGSSVTHGASASRSANSYEAMLSNRLDFDFINLGFAGNALGEQEMAKYIAGLQMSAFVYDYDHNAPTAEYLKGTHENMFKLIRNAHPDLPIICLTKPYPAYTHGDERLEIIEKTVTNAKSKGDKNVYFLDIGRYLKAQGIENELTVDGTHPNDLGFYFMARAIEEILNPLL